MCDDSNSSEGNPSFQQRVQPWMMACFGPEIAADVTERNHRFLEEALELVQSCGATQAEARHLVDYVYGRPAGETAQEIGGVMVTLAALCLAHGQDMHAAGERELARIWTKVEQIRDRQLTKPRRPMETQPSSGVAPDVGRSADVKLGEAYQVIASIAAEFGVLDHPDVIRALDNAANCGDDHDDLLPWPRTPLVPANGEPPVKAWQPTHRHYKGGLYRVLFDAIHTETEEPMTVYQTPDGRNWVRPAAMFNDTLPDGRRRFAPIDPGAAGSDAAG
jgi:hypothetical protein